MDTEGDIEPDTAVDTAPGIVPDSDWDIETGIDPDPEEDTGTGMALDFGADIERDTVVVDQGTPEAASFVHYRYRS